MADSTDVIIRPYRDSDSLQKLTEMLHRAYAPLASMGFRYFATHQKVDDTRRRIAAGTCYVAESNSQIVGTITCYQNDRNTKAPPLYHEPGVAHFAQFAVEPSLQRSGIGASLVAHIESTARDVGCKVMAMDTAEGATHLVTWYQRLGYQIVGHTKWDVTNYRSVIMSKSLCSLILLFSILFATHAFAQKTLIEFGWDEPDTEFMLHHIPEMEKTPFDGTVFHITYEKPDGSRGRFMNEAWSDRPFTTDELKRSADELKRTPFKKFNENFLRFNVIPGDVDWFDDFDAVMNNGYLAARVARDGKCRGVLFDIEAYDKPLWDYRKQKHAATKSWEDYAKQARDRGRLLMTSFQDGFGENIVVFMTFAYSLPWSETNGDAAKLPQVQYGLLKPFLDGMIEAARPSGRIVDGYEISYGYRQAQEFADAEQLVHEKLATFATDPEKYRRVVGLAFGLWMDHDWRKNGWDMTDVEKNYFSPDRFATSLKFALDKSDEFVWVYTEKPKWWSETGRQQLPDVYLGAVEKSHNFRQGR